MHSYTAFIARPSYSKHSLQNTQQFIYFSVRQTSQALYKSTHVDSPQLVCNNLAIFTIELAAHPKGVRMTSSCERSNYVGTKVNIQLIR